MPVRLRGVHLFLAGFLIVVFGKQLLDMLNTLVSDGAMHLGQRQPVRPRLDCLANSWIKMYDGNVWIVRRTQPISNITGSASGKSNTSV